MSLANKIKNVTDEEKRICVWIKGSTNKDTLEDERCVWCSPDCDGYNVGCERYVSYQSMYLELTKTQEIKKGDLG